MFEPSERLWWVWGLILNVILPLLPTCWGFSFALGCGISPHSCSSNKQLPLQDLLELTPQKDVLFFIGVWNAKVGCQEISGAMGKFGLGVQDETRQRLTEFCQENTLVIANTLFQQHKRRLYTWISLDGQYQNQIDYILCSQRWRSSIQSAKTRLGADCGPIMNSLLPNSDLN